MISGNFDCFDNGEDLADGQNNFNSDEEVKLLADTNELEEELAELQEQLAAQEQEQRQQEATSKQLDICLHEIKEMGEKLKSDASYIQHGYVVKQDLINVYKNEENNSSEDDVLLLI